MAPTVRPWYRRAVVLYLVTVVLPACALVWLGLQSFERQRDALETLRAEKLETELEARLRAGADAAFSATKHPISKFTFTIDRGEVVRPALYAPLPQPTPAAFVEAEREELSLGRPDLALASYRRLLAGSQSESLAMARIARCLAKLGRDAEARETWRTLARSYPDERDPSHRPYGIVAAMAAGETAGLFDLVASGRWELAGDQAEYFLSALDPARDSAYLDQFRFARELRESFRPQSMLGPGERASYTFGNRRVFYRTDGPDRVVGFLVNSDWVDRELRPELERAMAGADSARQGVLFYGGAIALVLLMLSAGVGLIWRDVERETRTNQLRADFVSGVTHELKTPLTLIRLYGETLLRHSQLPEADRREFFRVITRESARLGRLIDQVLAVSRVDRSGEVYDLRDGDLVPVVEGVIDDYSDWLEHSGFTVSRDLPGEAPPVRFDAAALQQAVVNLLDNAAKYSGASREIAVRVGAGNGHVTLEVEDHGIGIPPAEQPRVFDRFYRVANSTGKGGYGLGLFMVQHIMRAHGGRAEVESTPGRGSTFRLVFPVVIP